MDRRAWQTTVHEVAKSRTQLSNFTHSLMAQTIMALFRLRVYRILQVALKKKPQKNRVRSKTKTKNWNQNIIIVPFEGRKLTQVKGKKVEKDSIPSTLTLSGFSCYTILSCGLREAWLKQELSLASCVTLLFCASVLVSSTSLIWLLGGLCEFVRALEKNAEAQVTEILRIPKLGWGLCV